MVAIAIALHTLGAVVWVGGMFLIYVCLRPAPQRSFETANYSSLRDRARDGRGAFRDSTGLRAELLCGE